VVNADGTIVSSSPGVTLFGHFGPGIYRLEFPVSPRDGLEGAAVTATLGSNTIYPGSYIFYQVPTGFIVAGIGAPGTGYGNQVIIGIRDQDGIDTDMPFMVIVALPSP
jgi:hypothetical protein